MPIYSIYKITNKYSGKCYIGFTQCIPTRWGTHRRRFSECEFTYEILYQSKDKSHCLNKMEPHFIAEHDSWKDGYNGRPGGFGGNTYKSGCKGTPNTIEQVKAELFDLAIRIQAYKDSLTAK